MTYGVEFVGPFLEPYKVAVYGYRVPHLAAYLVAGTEDTWRLVIDERFMLDVPNAEAERWMWFLAQAMAVAAGYSCHGEQSRQVNPYAVQMSAVTMVEREVER